MFDEQLRFHWKQIISAPLRSETHEEHAAWVDERSSSVPTYFGLCKQCFNEIYSWSLGLFCIEDIFVTSKNTELDTLVTHDGRSKPITKKRTVTQHNHILRWKVMTDDETLKTTLRMEDIEQRKWSILVISRTLSFFVFIFTYLFPIGHAFTAVGRAIWGVIFRKYFVFLCVCCGFWTDDAVICYGLKEVHMLEIDEYINLEKYQTAHTDEHVDLDRDPEATIAQVSLTDEIVATTEAVAEVGQTKRKFSILSTAMHKDDDDGIDWMSFSNSNGEEVVDLEMHGAVEVLSGTRAVIIQIIPYLTLFSIFAIMVSHSPIYCSERAKQFFPPFIVKDSFHRALIQEKEETNHALSAHKRGVMWVVWVKSLIILLKDSRLVQACIGYLKYFLTLGLLFAHDPYPWITWSLVIFFPMSLVCMLELYVYTGRYCGVVDEDLTYIFALFSIEYECRDTSDFEEEIPYQFGEASNIVLGVNPYENEAAVVALQKENKKLKIDVAAMIGYKVDKDGNPIEEALPMIDENHPESPKKAPLLL